MKGQESDAFTAWRHLLLWKAGERKALKRKYHRRWRKIVREELRSTIQGGIDGIQN